jgi:hypothetical protein
MAWPRAWRHSNMLMKLAIRTEARQRFERLRYDLIHEHRPTPRAPVAAASNGRRFAGFSVRERSKIRQARLPLEAR